ncbi:MAG: M20 family metallo-hydrolase [Planctomycetota bacterium]
MTPDLDVQPDRLLERLHTLATFSADPAPPPAVTRVVYTEPDRDARAYLINLCEDAGLAVRIDPIGNTFARWTPPGVDPAAPAVGTGSHIDAIPNAGMYDGTVGVLGGLEAIQQLQAAGFPPKRPIELLIFTSEEPTRFDLGCLGSRALAGVLTPDDLRKLQDLDGVSLDDARVAAGFAGDLADVRLPENHYDAWVELHIEQGPVLERKKIPIGIVMGIAAPATTVFTAHGEGGHAGAVLMPDRRDALCAAAEAVHGIEQLARSSPSPDLVATVGELDVFPGAVNSIPSRVRFTLDLRDTDEANRNGIAEAIDAELANVAQRRGVRFDTRRLNADAPAACDKRVIDAAEAACDRAGLRWWKMVSRAYHDSLFLARLAPTGMVFVPCRAGVSHRPDEHAEPADLAAGVEVLAHTLAHLSHG